MTSNEPLRAGNERDYFIDGAEAFAPAVCGDWRDIRSAPALQCVLVGASSVK